jgi:hypothetical protein
MERYLGEKSPSEAIIMPDPNNIPIRTTVPLRKGLIIARYSNGNRPIKTALAGLFMVVLKTLVDTLAYMAEKMSNLSRKARNTSI